MANPARDERRHSAEPLRVLLVDDDLDMLRTLAAVLELDGYVVRQTSHGRDVLAVVRIFRPDAIVLDISVPEISGYALAQAVRFSFTDIRRPLMVAMSGVWKTSADKLVAQQVGFDHYLVKPCDTAELLRLLGSLRLPS